MQQQNKSHLIDYLKIIIIAKSGVFYVFTICIKRFVLPLCLAFTGMPAWGMEPSPVKIRFSDDSVKTFTGEDARLITRNFRTISNLQADSSSSGVVSYLKEEKAEDNSSDLLFSSEAFTDLLNYIKGAQQIGALNPSRRLQAIVLAHYLEMSWYPDLKLGQVKHPFALVEDIEALEGLSEGQAEVYRRILIGQFCDVLYKAPQKLPKSPEKKAFDRQSRFTDAPDGEVVSLDPEDKPQHVPSQSVYNKDKSRWVFFDSEKGSIAAYSGHTSAARFMMTFEGVERARSITFSAYFSEDQKYLDIARYGLQLDVLGYDAFKGLSWNALIALYTITHPTTEKKFSDTIPQIEEYCKKASENDASLLRAIFGIAQYNEQVKKPSLLKVHTEQKKEYVSHRRFEFRAGLGIVGLAGLFWGASKFFPSVGFSKLGSVFRWGSYVTGVLSLPCFWDAAKHQRSIWQLEKKINALS